MLQAVASHRDSNAVTRDSSRGVTKAEAEAEAEEEKTINTARKRALHCPEDVSQEIFEEWKAQRKAKKSAVSKIVLDGIRREAGLAGVTLEQAMVIQIERGWQGFKAEWLKTAPFASTRESEARRRMQQAVPNVADWSDKAPPQATDFFEAEARIVHEQKRIAQ